MEAMLRFLLVLGIMCYVVQIRAAETDGPDEEIQKKCEQEYNVDDSIFVNEGKFENDTDNMDITLKDDSNENHRCYVQCIMEGFGYIKDGKLDQEFAVNEVRKGLEDEGVEFELKDLEETIASCANKTGEGKCNTSYQIGKCLYDLSKEDKQQQ